MSYLQVEENDDAIVVSFAVRRLHDSATIQAVTDELIAVCSRAAARSKKMIVDFSNVDAAASMLVGHIVLLNKAAKERGVSLSLRRLAPSVRQLFVVSRLHKVLDLVDDEEEHLHESGSLNKYARTARIVHKYYRKLMSDIADHVQEHESDFRRTHRNSSVDEFFERSSKSLYEVASVYQNLRQWGWCETSVCRVHVVDTSKRPIDAAVNEWLADNPHFVVQSISIGEGFCLVLYREVADCS